MNRRNMALLMATLGLLGCGAFLVSQRIPPAADPAATAVFATRAVPCDEARNLNDHELVLGIVVAGQARAYPVGILQATEHVHDQCGDLPLCATW